MRALYVFVNLYPIHLRTLPGTSRIIFSASGLLLISTFAGELVKSTPKNVSTVSTDLVGEAGVENLIAIYTHPLSDTKLSVVGAFAELLSASRPTSNSFLYVVAIPLSSSL